MRGLEIVLPFCMRTVMIYVLGIQYLGLNGLFTSVLQVLNLAELGVGAAMVYSMYKPVASGDARKICALMQLYKVYYRAIGVIIACIGLCITPFIPRLITGEVPEGINVYVLYLLYLTATVISYWLFAYKNSILIAHQRNDVTSKVVIVIDIFRYSAQIAVLFLTHNYYLYVLVLLLSQAMINVVTAAAADRMYPQYKPGGTLERKEIQGINERIRDLFTSKFGSVILGSVDSIVISRFLGLAVLGIYQNYYYVLNSVYSIISIIFTSVLAGIGNSLISESVEKNYNDLKKFTFIISWIVCLCCCCFLCLYQPFMKMWVGEELMLSYGYVILLAVYFYVCAISLIWATIKDAAGLWHQDRFRPLIGASANLVINIILVRIIGLAGVILSTILSYVFITMPWLLHNLFTLLYHKSGWEYIRKLALYLVSTLAACSSCVFICSLFHFSPLLTLLINLFVCMTAANMILYLLLGRTKEFREAKQLVIRIIGNGAIAKWKIK